MNSKLELDFSPPLVVDSTGLNVTVRVDLTAWFRNGAGVLIDPATAVETMGMVVEGTEEATTKLRDQGLALG